MATNIEPSVGLYWYFNVDPTIGPGVNAPLWQIGIRTDNPSIYYKSGPSDTSWTLIGSAGGGPISLGIQSFIYIADGSETTAGFDINLPVARADTNYIALVQRGQTAEDFELAQPPATYTPTKFSCVPGANLTAGDTLLVEIIPTTA